MVAHNYYLLPSREREREREGVGKRAMDIRNFDPLQNFVKRNFQESMVWAEFDFVDSISLP